MGDARSTTTREALIRAAAEELNRRGFQGTNTNKIARAAGFAPATFYRYFADKREIMVAAFDWLLTEQRHAVLAVLDGVSSAETAARAIVEILVVHQKRWQTLIASALVVASTDPELGALLRNKRERDLEAMMLVRARFQGAPATREDDMLLLLALEGLCILLATSDIEALGLSEAGLVEQMARRIAAHLSG